MPYIITNTSKVWEQQQYDLGHQAFLKFQDRNGLFGDETFQFRRLISKILLQKNHTVGGIMSVSLKFRLVALFKNNYICKLMGLLLEDLGTGFPTSEEFDNKQVVRGASKQAGTHEQQQLRNYC